jgi:hypothetical protein
LNRVPKIRAPKRISSVVESTVVMMVVLFAFAITLVAMPLNSCCADETAAIKPAARKPVRAPVKLPGMLIDIEKRCVDLEAAICLDEGFLELIACTKDSKEHESLVSIDARAMHVHTGLLLLGATNGNPAMRKPVNEEETRWVDVPPQGDPIDVYLVFKNSDGKLVEHPIGMFVTRSGREPGVEANVNGQGVVDDRSKFSHTFLFAGSHLLNSDDGSRRYLADSSGNVISIATFGDELLCLPGVQSHANGALTWQVDSTHLPDAKTKVALRLRLRLQ